MQSLWMMPIRGTLNFSRGVRLKIILNFPEHTLKDCVVYFKSSPQRQTVLWLTHEQRKMMRVFDFEEPLNIMIVFIKPVFMILNTQQFSYNLMNLNFTNFPCTTRTNIDHAVIKTAVRASNCVSFVSTALLLSSVLLEDYHSRSI